MSVKYPPRRHYRPNLKPISYQELPFAARLPDRPRVHCWQVPPADDYRQAYLLGREYAGHFIQYVQDNPDAPGRTLLARIAGDVDFAAEGPEQGYWAGFFALIEQVLVFPIDIFGYIDRIKLREETLRQLAEKRPVNTE
ncbi:hypothetical protein VK98_03040 [Chromobacterium sp. LK11]|uniref:hypothetical protein n=1 Tax=Chromobacterium sp. LK11 TaxID=1628212 RepID=UPI000652967B|nr:hypothetical protein [Chromobacterium sp. LK11]KMN83397.1 hypothetical protein VK98_03040 [Chromobacterium sp. LK11]